MTGLLDDLIVFCKHPIAHQKSLSHLYSIFEMSLAKKFCKSKQEPIKIEPEAEKPINVFHTSRNNNEKLVKTSDKDKKSRVEILSKRILPKPSKSEDESKDSNKKSHQESKKDNRVFLKKVEFL